jgi:ribose transport system substrate-binding protein
MLAGDGFSTGRRSASRRQRYIAIGLLLACAVAGGCGGGSHDGETTSADPAVQQARADVDHAPPPTSAYRGPVGGPPAQPHAPVVFVAADLTDGGIAVAARGVQEAARAIGWPLQILDGQGNPKGERLALRAALRSRPTGIILGGVNAAAQQAALRGARTQGVPVVGWHAAPRPGPNRNLGLFTNVTSDPVTVARLAADYAITDSNGTANVAVFYDSEYAIDTYTAGLMASDIRRCRHCSVLQVFDSPIATASIGTVALVASLLERFGTRLDYLLAVNGAYIDGASTALTGAGVRRDQAPFSVTAGTGDESEFARVRADEYQKASVAEPLNLQGWQLVDELNRARAGQPPSGYITPPRLITQSDAPNGAVFDPPSGYRENYLRIWRRR